MLRKFFLFVAASCLALSLPGCLAMQLGMPNGLWFSTGESGFSGQYDDQWNYRLGEDCATSYFGIFAVGDASVSRIARAHNIEHVVSVSHQVKGYLGIWQSFCVIIRGY